MNNGHCTLINYMFFSEGMGMHCIFLEFFCFEKNFLSFQSRVGLGVLIYLIHMYNIFVRG